MLSTGAIGTICRKPSRHLTPTITSIKLDTQQRKIPIDFYSKKFTLCAFGLRRWSFGVVLYEIFTVGKLKGLLHAFTRIGFQNLLNTRNQGPVSDV